MLKRLVETGLTALILCQIAVLAGKTPMTDYKPAPAALELVGMATAGGVSPEESGDLQQLAKNEAERMLQTGDISRFTEDVHRNKAALGLMPEDGITF